MRILMVTRGLPFHSAGGMEAVSWDLAKAFVSMSNEVTVLTTHTPKLESDSIVEGVRIRCVDAPTARYSSAWWRESCDVYEREFSQWADVVLSVSAGAMEIAKQKKGVTPRFFAQAHGTAWGEALSKIRMAGIWPKLTSLKNLHSMIKDRSYRRFDGLIAVGEKVEKDLADFPTSWIMGSTPVFCVPNGVNASQFAFDPHKRRKRRDELGIPQSARVGLIASRLHAQKGIVEGLLGFERLRVQETTSLDYLIIAGSGPDRSRIEALIARKTLNDVVRVVGHVDRTEMRTVMSAADYFLFPTLRVEGLPMNVLEARANGLQVVLSSAIDHPDFAAVAIDPLQPDSIAAALASMTVNADRASQLPDEYTLAACARSYLSIFEEARAKR